jgi:hypothetical protein
MSALAPPIANKLGKLIRLLSSDKDGEVVAAVAAIRRTLNSENLTIHDLAEGLATDDRKFTESDAQEIYRRGTADGRREADHDSGFRSVDEPSWNEIARECEAASGRLNEREREFVGDMVRSTVRGGKPTEKQAKWLRAIYTRVRR